MGQETDFTGRCHCGNLEVTFHTTKPVDALPLRRCQCAFCRRHGALCTSDPAGRATVVVHDPAQLIRYSFGLKTADFLVCGRCGTYMGAVMPMDGDAMVAIVNVHTFDPPDALRGDGEPMVYDAESEAERRARRAAGWTPASIVTAGSGAPLQVSR